jgi:hypothetical protein
VPDPKTGQWVQEKDPVKIKNSAVEMLEQNIRSLKEGKKSYDAMNADEKAQLLFLYKKLEEARAW